MQKNISQHTGITQQKESILGIYENLITKIKRNWSKIQQVIQQTDENNYDQFIEQTENEIDNMHKYWDKEETIWIKLKEKYKKQKGGKKQYMNQSLKNVIQKVNKNYERKQNDILDLSTNFYNFKSAIKTKEIQRQKIFSTEEFLHDSNKFVHFIEESYKQQFLEAKNKSQARKNKDLLEVDLKEHVLQYKPAIKEVQNMLQKILAKKLREQQEKEQNQKNQVKKANSIQPKLPIKNQKKQTSAPKSSENNAIVLGLERLLARKKAENELKKQQEKEQNKYNNHIQKQDLQQKDKKQNKNKRSNTQEKHMKGKKIIYRQNTIEEESEKDSEEEQQNSNIKKKIVININSKNKNFNTKEDKNKVDNTQKNNKQNYKKKNSLHERKIKDKNYHKIEQNQNINKQEKQRTRELKNINQNLDTKKTKEENVYKEQDNKLQVKKQRNNNNDPNRKNKQIKKNYRNEQKGTNQKIEKKKIYKKQDSHKHQNKEKSNDHHRQQHKDQSSDHHKQQHRDRKHSHHKQQHTEKSNDHYSQQHKDEKISHHRSQHKDKSPSHHREKHRNRLKNIYSFQIQQSCQIKQQNQIEQHYIKEQTKNQIQKDKTNKHTIKAQPQQQKHDKNINLQQIKKKKFKSFKFTILKYFKSSQIVQMLIEKSRRNNISISEGDYFSDQTAEIESLQDINDNNTKDDNESLDEINSIDDNQKTNIQDKSLQILTKIAQKLDIKNITELSNKKNIDKIIIKISEQVNILTKKCKNFQEEIKQMTEQIIKMSEQKNKSDSKFQKLFKKFTLYKNYYKKVTT